MEEPQKTYRFNNTNKTLIITTKHELPHPQNKELIVGSREVTDYYDEQGIKEMLKELNAQKNSYERQRKILNEQINKMNDVEVDIEFLEKVKAIQSMQQKQDTENKIRNADEAIKEINHQLNDVKGVIKNYIKL